MVMSQESTERMLEVVGWANRRIDRLGLTDVVAIVYTDGAARLLNSSGRTLLEERGDPGLAVGFLVFQFERRLLCFLSDSGSRDPRSF